MIFNQPQLVECKGTRTENCLGLAVPGVTWKHLVLLEGYRVPPVDAEG